MRPAMPLPGWRTTPNCRKADTAIEKTIASGHGAAGSGRPSRYSALILPLLALALTACGSPTSAPTPQPSATPRPIETAIPATPGDLPHSLDIWLSPRFAPGPNSPAGPVLLERLQAFEAKHESVQLTIRVKAESGPGSLRESLATAGEAASGALPDLVLLTRGTLVESSQLFVPSTQIGLPPESTEVYDFARPAEGSGAQALGIPFAADLEILAHRTTNYDSPPLTWGALLSDQSSLLVPASDPEARFLLAQYLAVGGSVEQIEIGKLAEALGFLASADSSGALIGSSIDFATSEETWEAFLAGRGAAATAPFSSFVSGFEPLDYAAGPLPTSDGQGIALSENWSWALLNDEPIALALVEWLTDPDFVAEWTYALGLVPAQPSVLERWPDSPQTALASRLVSVAVPLPEPDRLADYGPAFTAALRAVLQEDLSPEQAAAMAASSG